MKKGRKFLCLFLICMLIPALLECTKEGAAPEAEEAERSTEQSVEAAEPSDCSNFYSSAGETAPSSPAPTEPATTLPVPAEPEPTAPALTEPETTVPAPTEPATTAPAPTEPESTIPAPMEPETEPVHFQAGDTTPTWNPKRAEGYPADADCSAELLLGKWMAVEGLTTADLDARGCQQLILVSAQPADGVTTLTVCYERGADGAFLPTAGLERLRGFVGKNGIRHDRRRESDTSPAGLWAISSAFGNEAPPEDLKLPWRQVTPNSDWVCDEESPYFNTWRERGGPGLLPWSDDVEHLEDYPTQYAWACVIEFNRPPDVVPARGCAIFLHCSERATGGCVGLKREDMLAVLRWLDVEKHPFILITGAERG